MAFFSRPNLDNLQFKQEIDDILNLKGKTIIENPSGLTFFDDNEVEIPVIIENVEDGKVLTYVVDGNGKGSIILDYGDGSSGSTKYYGRSPVTTEVGGWKIGEHITGNSINQIIQKLLAPALEPTLTAPTYTMGLYYVGGDVVVSQANRLMEVGSKVGENSYNDSQFYVKTTFNRGGINPIYESDSPHRSGINNRYVYRTFIGSQFDDTTNIMGENEPTHTVDKDLNFYEGNPNFKISLGNNWIRSSVYYDEGVQPKNSEGEDFGDRLPAGQINVEMGIEGIYPYFYGKSTTKPSVDDINLLSGSTTDQNNTINDTKVKVIKKSNNNIIIDFKFQEGEDEKYIWFAIPTSSGKKTNWEVTTLNAGTIGSTELFASPITKPKSSENWSEISYDIYISNYVTDVESPMTIS